MKGFICFSFYFFFFQYKTMFMFSYSPLTRKVIHWYFAYECKNVVRINLETCWHTKCPNANKFSSSVSQKCKKTQYCLHMYDQNIWIIFGFVMLSICFDLISGKIVFFFFAVFASFSICQVDIIFFVTVLVLVHVVMQTRIMTVIMETLNWQIQKNYEWQQPIS